MQPSEVIAPPVIPEGSQEKTSCLAQIGWAIGLGVAGFVFITLFPTFRMARAKAAMFQRSDGLRAIAEAAALYERSHHVALSSLPDWKKSLIDGGFISEKVFESNDAAHGQIDYLLMSRPSDQFVPGLSSWIAICEDPRSLDDPEKNLWLNFADDGDPLWCTRRQLPEYMKNGCQHLNLPYDPAVLAPAFPPDASPATTYPK